MSTEEILPQTGDRLSSILESLLLATDKPLTARQLQALVGERDLGTVEAALELLEQHYAGRGVRLCRVAGGLQFRTAPENAAWVQKLVAGRPARLTRTQLETLAIVAYRQPITRPEIDEIRGVDSGAVLKMLLDRNLIRILGKKEEPGRPLLYGTSRAFLELFQLKDLRDLPTLREFHELSEEHRAEVDALEESAEAASVPSGAAPRPLAVDLAEIDPAEEDRLLRDLADAERHAEAAAAQLGGGENAAVPAAPQAGTD